MSERQDDPTTHERRPARLLLKPRSLGEEQKRNFERTTTRREVAVRIPGGDEPVSVPLVDVSATGVKLAVGQAVPVGSDLEVEVLPSEWLPVVVRWCQEEDELVVIGGEFAKTLSYDEVWKIRSFSV